MGAATSEIEARQEAAALEEGAPRPARGPREEAPIEDGTPEALRLWLRGAGIPDVVVLLEMVQAELATRKIVLEFDVRYEAPEPGLGK